MTYLTEAICWAAICFSPSGVEFYDPFAAQHYRIDQHYRNALWSNITYGLDCKIAGPGDQYDWIVVKYTKDPFAPLRPVERQVTHHERDGSLKETEERFY
jgi:hypothetical protein